MISPTPTRRTFLASAAVLPIVGPFPAASEITRLIDAHRSAEAAAFDAATRAEDLEAEFKADFGPGPELQNFFGEGALVPRTDFRDAEFAVDQCIQPAKSTLYQACETLAARTDDVRAERAELIDRYARNRAMVETAVAEIEAAQVRFGLAAARRREADAHEAMNEALRALCACPCRSATEAEMKADYLENAKVFDDGIPRVFLAELIAASIPDAARPVQA